MKLLAAFNKHKFCTQYSIFSCPNKVLGGGERLRQEIILRILLQRVGIVQLREAMFHNRDREEQQGGEQLLRGQQQHTRAVQLHQFWHIHFYPGRALYL